MPTAIISGCLPESLEFGKAADFALETCRALLRYVQRCRVVWAVSALVDVSHS